MLATPLSLLLAALCAAGGTKAAAPVSGGAPVVMPAVSLPSFSAPALSAPDFPEISLQIGHAEIGKSETILQGPVQPPKGELSPGLSSDLEAAPESPSRVYGPDAVTQGALIRADEATPAPTVPTEAAAPLTNSSQDELTTRAADQKADEASLSSEASLTFDGAKKGAGSMTAVAASVGSESSAPLARSGGAAKKLLPAAALGLAPLVAHGAGLPHADGVLFAAGGLGFALGMRHALDPDHVIALLNLVTGKKSKWSGWRMGALWGLGHSVSLAVAGGLMVAAKAAVPEPWAAAFECLVGAMLVVLGVASIIRERKTAEHGHYHDLDQLRMKPFFIGMVHGLAGSGAVALLALAAVPGTAASLLYLGLFGLGTIAGMSVVTLFIQALAVRLVGDPKVRGRVAVAVGALSAAFGLFMLIKLLPSALGF